MVYVLLLLFGLSVRATIASEKCNNVNQQLTHSSGIIENVRDNSGEYYGNERCGWNITVRPGRAIRFEFERVDLEAYCLTGDCKCDWVTIYDGRDKNAPRVRSACRGSSNPNPVTTSSNVAYVYFESDRFHQHWGFRIRYKEVERNLDCSDSLKPYDNCWGYCHHGGDECKKKCGHSCNCDTFYCRKDRKCYGRCHRCDPTVCDESAEIEGCSGARQGRYPVIVGESGIAGISGIHRYVKFRGFTYEFGRAYHYMERDTTDPEYRYACQKHTETLKFYSTCSRENVLNFMDNFRKKNPNYNLWKCNCWDFAIGKNGLLEYLKTCDAYMLSVNGTWTPLETSANKRASPPKNVICEADDCAKVCENNAPELVVNSKGEYICGCSTSNP